MLIEPYTAGFYSNADKAQRTFRGNYPRLVSLKSGYDIENLFRLNANIKPTF